MSTKAKIQKVLAEIEAHEGRGWLAGYQAGLAKREASIVTAQAALEKKNKQIRELSSQKKSPNPTSAREALDLAWELAHPVKKGQTLPSGTQYLLRHGLGYNLEVSLGDRRVDSVDAQSIRTLEPLPDPLPDWLNAPAVLATGPKGTKGVWTQVPISGPVEYWTGDGPEQVPWSELTDVTPLQPIPDQPEISGVTWIR